MKFEDIKPGNAMIFTATIMLKNENFSWGMQSKNEVLFHILKNLSLAVEAHFKNKNLEKTNGGKKHAFKNEMNKINS